MLYISTEIALKIISPVSDPVSIPPPSKLSRSELPEENGGLTSHTEVEKIKLLIPDDIIIMSFECNNFVVACRYLF